MEPIKITVLFLLLVGFHSISANSKIPFKIKIQHNTSKSCLTKDGRPGICTLTSYCNDKQEIEHGGIILDAELREITTCKKYVEWCCTEKNVTAPPPSPTRRLDTTCQVSSDPNCPWCVNLYRNGTYNVFSDSGLYCMGTMVGSRVVLTTATCVLQEDQNIWVQMPSSADPNAVYTFHSRHRHPQYNSGTREYDLALLVLDKEMEWSSGYQGACLEMQPVDFGSMDCIGAGMYADFLDMNPLSLKDGNCGGRGSAMDSSCATVIGGFCSAVSGAPVMCRPNAESPFIVAGMTKVECTAEQPELLIGHLDKGREWLVAHLGILGLDDKDYLQDKP